MKLIICLIKLGEMIEVVKKMLMIITMDNNNRMVVTPMVNLVIIGMVDIIRQQLQIKKELKTLLQSLILNLWRNT